jgi:FkbM family methyltransferase
MNLLQAFRRPEYFFNPRQLVRRLRKAHLAETDQVRLVWGLPVRTQPGCCVTVDILNLGVYDLIVPETIVRLLDPGEIAVDVGANIGQNTSIMACAVGPAGHVTAFEPHPELWNVLCDNVERWQPYQVGSITPVRKACGANEETAILYESAEFPSNQGSASLRRPHDARRQHEIEVTTLECHFGPQIQIGLAKLDVEYHEESVLQGARRLLDDGQIRDIVFEDYAAQPSPVTRILEATGYSVFELYKPWLGPGLIPRAEHLDRRPNGIFWSNYLATREPARARARLAPRGWRVLRTRPRLRNEN